MSPNRTLNWLRRLRQWANPPSSTARQRRGRANERLARAYLERHGYDIEAVNVRYPFGELDLVARERETLCFVEVRSVSSARFGSAAESIRSRKQRHVARAARYYLRQRRPAWSGPVRLDVVTIDDAASTQPLVTLIRGAFDA